MKIDYVPSENVERLNRAEMTGMKWFLSVANCIVTEQENLKRRLRMIPDGEKRYGELLEMLRSMLSDISGTIPLRQVRSLQNMMEDMDLRIVPKLTPSLNRVTMGILELAYIVSLAKKQKCTSCILTGDECKGCELYQIMESTAPLKEYGEGVICPYSKDDWVER